MEATEQEQRPTEDVSDAREDATLETQTQQAKAEQAKPKADAPFAASLSVIEGTKFFQELKRTDFLSAVTESLPAHVNPELWTRHMLTYFRDHPQLQACSFASIHAALLNCAASGLDLGFGDRAYLVPFYNPDLRVSEAKFMPSYLGLIDLMRNSGMVKHVRAHVVYENDFIEVTQGSKETIEHRPVWKNRGEPVGVYSVAVFMDDTTEFLTMTAGEVEDVKAFALAKVRNKERSGWNGPFEDRYWEKTVIRRHAKTLPLSPATRKALGDLEAYEEREAESAPIDVTGGEIKQSRADQVSARLKERAAWANR